MIMQNQTIAKISIYNFKLSIISMIRLIIKQFGFGFA